MLDGIEAEGETLICDVPRYSSIVIREENGSR
jgi:hypothetical protein